LKTNRLGIAVGGEQRLREAIEAEVRREYLEALAAEVDNSKRLAIEEKIKKEIKARMRRVASPYSLWCSQA
jgi:hypothetical protein